MTWLLSSLVNNNFEKVYRITYKLGKDDKKWETCGIKYKYCNCILEYNDFKHDLIECKSLRCNKSCRRKFD